jgi:alpha-amylase
MSTKFWSDGDVHKYFSPYDSPYKAYINYMNACSDLEYRIEKVQQEQSALTQAPAVAAAGM